MGALQERTLVAESAVRRLAPLDPRIPTWGHPLIDRPCPIGCAASSEAYAVRPDGLTVHRCECCGASFVSPAPSPDALGEFYSAYNTDHRATPLTPARAQHLLAASPADDHRIVEIASQRDLRDARVLDVGCGDGTTLARFRSAGAHVTGIDLDHDAVRFVNESLGIPALVGDLLTSTLGDDPFDVVTMLDFIEHPLDPLPYVERVYDLLADHGLLVLWTPNGSAISAANDFTTLRVDLEHMQYLSFASVARIAAFGFQVVHIEGSGYPSLEQFHQSPPATATHAGAGGRVRAKLRSLKRRARVAASVLVRGSVPGQPTPPASSPIEDRHGSYHLLAILQKP